MWALEINFSLKETVNFRKPIVGRWNSFLFFFRGETTRRLKIVKISRGTAASKMDCCCCFTRPERSLEDAQGCCCCCLPKSVPWETKSGIIKDQVVDVFLGKDFGGKGVGSWRGGWEKTEFGIVEKIRLRWDRMIRSYRFIDRLNAQWALGPNNSYSKDQTG